jgi:Cu/Ag efflux pump CusA
VALFAAFPGASAEEVERQLAIPLEVTLAGIPRLQSVRTSSGVGQCCLYARFEPGCNPFAARQEVINRLQFGQPLPPGVFPQLVPCAVRQTVRYLVVGPRTALGAPVYTVTDLRTLQDWHLEREFRRVPALVDVRSTGGTVKRYEIHLEPDRLRRFGLTLQQVATAVDRGNVDLNGELLIPRTAPLDVRALGLLGGGMDTFSAQVLKSTDPQQAASLIRTAEKKRLSEIRAVVVTNGPVPVTVGDVVEGGPLPPGQEEGVRGVVVAGERREWVAFSGPGTAEVPDAVQGVALLRPGEDPGMLREGLTRIQFLNTTPGMLLPGVSLEPYCVGTSDLRAVWVYGTFPVGVPLETVAERARTVTGLVRAFPEVERVVSRSGPVVDGPPELTNHLELFIGLKVAPDAPAAPGLPLPRDRAELLGEFNRLLSERFPGVDWLTTTKSPEELGWSVPGVLGEHLLLLVGPDLDELERLATPVQVRLRGIPGVESVAAYRTRGRPRLEVRIDNEKCRKWGVRTADVASVLGTALGKGASQMIEGEKRFDITLLWPKPARDGDTAILDLPIDLVNNLADLPSPITARPRVRLRDLVSPVGKDGEPDPNGDFVRAGAAAIFRADGRRVLPIRFGVRSRPLADLRAEAASKIAPLLEAPYKLEWAD